MIFPSIFRHTKLVLVGVPLVLLAILLLILPFANKSSSPESQNQRPEPTQFQTNKQNQSPRTAPPVKYNTSQAAKLIERVQNPTELSTKDATAKQQVINSLGNKPAVAFSSQNVRVEYITPPGIFMAEITSVDISGAKNEAETWFLDQGFSKEGICTLPLTFYLNYVIAQQLKPLNITFNPLPEGC